MQYLLTEDEYAALKKQASQLADHYTAKLQDLCTRVANCEPVKVVWMTGDPTPWGCILTPESLSEYCDECPVRRICPYPNKNWSK